MKTASLSTLFALALSLFFAASGTADEPSPIAEETLGQEGAAADEICPASNQKIDRLEIKNNDENDPDGDEAKTYVDPNRSVKDFGTSIVVNEFFSSNDTLFNFLKLVYTTIDSRLKEYLTDNDLDDKSAFLLFKGGNVLRIVANQVFSLLPPEARDLLEKTYAENFKRSDLDFTIFVDEKKLNGLDYEEVMDDLTKVTYDALGEIRTEYNHNPEKYFNFWRLNNREAERTLSRYLENLKDLDATLDPNNANWYRAKFTQLQLIGQAAKEETRCRYAGQIDYRYEFKDKDKQNILGIPLTKNQSWVMNTINEALEWKLGKNLVKFYLVRAKAQFEYTYSKDGKLKRKPIGAEVADVSFPHKDDFRTALFLKHYQQMVANFTLRLNNDEALNFKAESITGLSTDIYDVLFNQFDRPWQGAKYVKRLNRLIFLAVVEMLGTLGTGSKEAQSYLSQVKEQIVAPLSTLFPLDPIKSKAVVEKIAASSAKLAQKFGQLGNANRIWSGLTQVSTTLVSNPQEGDAKEFLELLNTIKANLDVIKQLNEMEPYKIKLNKVYDNVPMRSLL